VCGYLDLRLTQPVDHANNEPYIFGTRGGCVRTILCYGDSNTWGSDPETRERFTEDVRWPGVLSKRLGEEHRKLVEAVAARIGVIFG
jgi:lysophospholipase L1-like esterase